jgi:hypothetical protein
MTWQPIETAPIDGKPVALIGPIWRHPFVGVVLPDAMGVNCYLDGLVVGGMHMHATHWMPLPDPPTVDEGRSDPARVQSDAPAQGERLRDADSSSLVRSSSFLRTLVEQLDAVQGELDRAKREITSPADDRLIKAMEALLASLLSPVEGRQPPLCVDAKDALD